MSFNFNKMIEILCWLLLMQIGESSSTSANHGLSNDLRIIHQEIRLIKEENLDQSHQIFLLTKILTESDQEKNVDRDDKASIIHELINRTKNYRIKRPYRLLPLTDHQTETPDQPKRFYGPPTNCSDLSQLGHTLNGFYLVKPADKKITDLEDFTQQPEIIYCAFKRPEKIPSYPFDFTKKRLHFNNHSTKVGNRIQFHASRTPTLNTVLSDVGVVQFNDLKFNLGEGFNATNGVFTVPKSGFYQFFIQGRFIALKELVRDNVKFDFFLGIFKNADSIEYIQFNNNNLFVSMMVHFKLIRGDKIHLKYFRDGKNSRFDKMIWLNAFWFSGNLLEEN